MKLNSFWIKFYEILGREFCGGKCYVLKFNFFVLLLSLLERCFLEILKIMKEIVIVGILWKILVYGNDFVVGRG